MYIYNSYESNQVFTYVLFSVTYFYSYHTCNFKETHITFHSE